MNVTTNKLDKNSRVKMSWGLISLSCFVILATVDTYLYVFHPFYGWGNIILSNQITTVLGALGIIAAIVGIIRSLIKDNFSSSKLSFLGLLLNTCAILTILYIVFYGCCR